MEELKPTQERVVCCIGDIHGHINKLQNLWSNLEKVIGAPDFDTALIIFLGDYCDHGPNTREVLDFLVSLPPNYPKQSHVFLSGNHDFAFAAFIGVLPPLPDKSDFSDTWEEYAASEKRGGWYTGDDYENMHLQGRMWAGSMTVNLNDEFLGSIYDAAALLTWLKQFLMNTQFLADMVWVHEEDKLTAVHAGLEKGKESEKQLSYLKARDTSVPKLEPLTGRKNVWDIPLDLKETPTIVVSGHHGKLHIEGLRLIIDEGGS